MDGAWTVIKYITNHSKPLSIFREIVAAASTWEGRKVPTKKELTKYCETRFASKVLMLQGYLPLRCAIEALVAHPAHTAWVKSHKSATKDTFSEIDKENHSM